MININHSGWVLDSLASALPLKRRIKGIRERLLECSSAISFSVSISSWRLRFTTNRIEKWAAPNDDAALLLPHKQIRKTNLSFRAIRLGRITSTTTCSAFLKSCEVVSAMQSGAITSRKTIYNSRKTSYKELELLVFSFVIKSKIKITSRSVIAHAFRSNRCWCVPVIFLVIRLKLWIWCRPK